MVVFRLIAAAAQFATSLSDDRPPVRRSRASRSRSSRPRAQGFSLSDWSGWKAPDDHTLLLRVRERDIYRIDLAHETSLLHSPDARLVSVVQDNETVRRPIDLDLRVSDTLGAAVALQATAITRLSEAEIDALPRDDRP